MTRASMSSRRIRHHLNPLRADLLAIGVARVAVPAGAPIEVELGCAEAHFLIERAVHEPDNFYVGVELRDLMVDKVNRALRAAGNTRVVTVFANMMVDLDRMFAPASVARFHLLFPDPWWKARQRKRRVAGDELVAAMVRLLRPGGEIHVATDIFSIALEAMAALEEEGGLRNLAGPWTFLRNSPFAARSRREVHCDKDGVRVWRVAYRRDGSA